ncbi:MAG: 6,7-dimethyl-8-ribityllumazine synthase [Fimbriimonadaceae bacterium]
MNSAKLIREAMGAKGVSVQELAKRTNLSYQKLWNKLHGRTALSIEEADQIMEALGGPRAVVRNAPVQKARSIQTNTLARARMGSDGLRFAIVVSRWNEFVTKELLEGAKDELARHGNPEVMVVHVPGTWEIPVAARSIAGGNWKPDAIIALGCIIQGQTPHAAILGGDVGSALMSLQTATGIPIAWGVLTPDSQDQALDRAGLKMGHKGREAALAAIEMANLIAQLR